MLSSIVHSVGTQFGSAAPLAHSTIAFPSVQIAPLQQIARAQRVVKGRGTALETR